MHAVDAGEREGEKLSETEVGRGDHWQVKESERKDLGELVQNKTSLFSTRLHANV